MMVSVIVGCCEPIIFGVDWAAQVMMAAVIVGFEIDTILGGC